MAAVFWFVDDAGVCDPKLRSEVCEPVAAVEAVVEFDVGLFAVKVQYLELACFCGWCGVCFRVVKNDIQITFAMRCCRRIFLCSSWSDEFAIFGIVFFLDCIRDVGGQVQGEVDVFPFGVVVFILPVRVGVWVHVGFACCSGAEGGTTARQAEELSYGLMFQQRAMLPDEHWRCCSAVSLRWICSHAWWCWHTHLIE